MPVDDAPVHEKVKHDKVVPGCYDRPDGVTCRQIGRKQDGEWVPLDECVGCNADRDCEYIANARVMIDLEMARFMKADQRCL